MNHLLEHALVETKNCNVVDSVKIKAIKLLDMINQEIYTLRADGKIKSLHSRHVPGHGITYEWIYKDFRVGFTVEPPSIQSGWYIVGDKNNIDVAHGPLLLEDSKIITWLLQYLLLNGDES